MPRRSQVQAAWVRWPSWVYLTGTEMCEPRLCQIREPKRSIRLCDPMSRLAPNVFTDNLASYRKLEDEYVHHVIDHAECYAKGQVHTNGLEKFWSLLKRGINGTYISVEPFHLFRNLDEQAWRYNNREMSDRDRFFRAVVRGCRQAPDLQRTDRRRVKGGSEVVTMPSSEYDVAHIRESGQDLIVVFVISQVNAWSASQKDDLRYSLEICGHEAGLAGTAVLVWQVGSQWRTWAPSNVQGILNRLSIEQLALSVNGNGVRLRLESVR